MFFFSCDCCTLLLRRNKSAPLLFVSTSLMFPSSFVDFSRVTEYVKAPFSSISQTFVLTMCIMPLSLLFVKMSMDVFISIFKWLSVIVVAYVLAFNLALISEQLIGMSECHDFYNCTSTLFFNGTFSFL